MASRREAVAVRGPVCCEAVIPPPCPFCSVLHSGSQGQRASMTSADCCPAVRVACAGSQSVSAVPAGRQVARYFPGHDAALPGEAREWSLHRRGMYPIPWSTGLRCVVPTRPRDMSLLCRSCSSPRSTVAGFLQTPPHGDALALDS